MALRRILIIVIGVLAAAVPQNLCGQEASVIELTKTDLFDNAGWNSSKVRILGIRLGTPRNQVRVLLQSAGFNLTEQDRPGSCKSRFCVACNSSGLCPGIWLTFDASEQVKTIGIERIPTDAIEEVRKIAITKRFKGRTYSFFNNYSTQLREQLLGTESIAESDARYPGAKTYRYDHLGVVVRVLLSRYGPEKESDLSVEFIQPK